jgi:2-iminobutanoate/2-iminopropanoate deaminase
MSVVQGDIQVQTRQALTNMRAVLAEAGSDFDHVVKTTVFLQDMVLLAALLACNLPPQGRF